MSYPDKNSDTELLTNHYTMFIDDERDPSFLKRFNFSDEDIDMFNVVRSSASAIGLITAMRALPDFISFDHDLGGEDTARTVVLWLLDELVEERLVMPKTFNWFVHSQNPIGAEWINGTMKGLYNEFAGEIT